MACEVCQHCDTSVEPGEGALHDGLSYHTHCHNCFVCGETDLRNAETFRGVIFCSGCSQRIFQGCSTARQGKFLKAKRRSPRRRRRRSDRVIMPENDSELSYESRRNFNNRVPSMHSHVINKTKAAFLKKDSAERGTTTYVTQETLKRARNHEIRRTILPAPVKPRKKRKTHKHKHHKNDCSDLRIAELGASIEIAHVALRKPSEVVPVIIKSETYLKPLKTQSLSDLNQKSDISGDSNKWKESSYTSGGDSVRTPWMQRRIGSILKIPLKCFKRNIIDRSSLVSVLSNSERNKCALRKLKIMFNEDILEHQRNGIKKLYSTLNRRNVPYKLGWPNTTVKPNKRCKHYENSHSYRCMRNQVMRLAGPTRSELAVIREKLLNAVSPNNLKNIIEYNKKYVALLSTQAFRRNYS
ncbi:uncharacterized protein [Epargyreus clarus]|uniref:uncharacterized protein n=1 Tax=Epargyreus clarus TaxID=520877 RepID=UPI003C2F0E82